MMTDKKTNYQALSKALDEALAKLQSPDLDVDEAVEVYERGMKLAKQLEAYLNQAENTFVKVKADWEARVQKS